MSDQVGNPEDRFSHNEAHLKAFDVKASQGPGVFFPVPRTGSSFHMQVDSRVATRLYVEFSDVQGQITP